MNEASQIFYVPPGDPPRGDVADTVSAVWTYWLANDTSTNLEPGTWDYYIVQDGWAQGWGNMHTIYSTNITG
jgi:hypothetical protein